MSAQGIRWPRRLWRRHPRGSQPAGRTRRLQPLHRRQAPSFSRSPRRRGLGRQRHRRISARGSERRLSRPRRPEANRHLPEFDTHDRYGRRIDLVRFHPSYHQLMKTSIEEGLHSSPWTDPRQGACRRAPRASTCTARSSRPRLPDQHDVRLRAGANAAARCRQAMAAEDFRRANTTRETCRSTRRRA